MRLYVLRVVAIRVNEASECSKTKISSFQSVAWEYCSKLEINPLHNLKTSIKFMF